MTSAAMSSTSCRALKRIAIPEIEIDAGMEAYPAEDVHVRNTFIHVSSPMPMPRPTASCPSSCIGRLQNIFHEQDAKASTPRPTKQVLHLAEALLDTVPTTPDAPAEMMFPLGHPFQARTTFVADVQPPGYHQQGVLPPQFQSTSLGGQPQSYPPSAHPELQATSASGQAPCYQQAFYPHELESMHGSVAALQPESYQPYPAAIQGIGDGMAAAVQPQHHHQGPCFPELQGHMAGVQPQSYHQAQCPPELQGNMAPVQPLHYQQGPCPPELQGHMTGVQPQSYHQAQCPPELQGNMAPVQPLHYQQGPCPPELQGHMTGVQPQSYHQSPCPPGLQGTMAPVQPLHYHQGPCPPELQGNMAVVQPPSFQQDLYPHGIQDVGAGTIAGQHQSCQPAPPIQGSLMPLPPVHPPSQVLEVQDANVSEAPSQPAPGTLQLPSMGSKDHLAGDCKPCAFLFTKGCEMGATCKFCHLCDAGEKKRRQKAKKAMYKLGGA
eukprot:TRINITY_DN26_c0_g1_i2.p1 TRINITY_DN26_c0_g1~~TRINITY_DN26_c0_g1_i2.p1  ORF type:complete len:492 (-),score=100.18 TRINITY_DN26_c0_g1_i2:227-1702(-)